MSERAGIVSERVKRSAQLSLLVLFVTGLFSLTPFSKNLDLSLYNVRLRSAAIEGRTSKLSYRIVLVAIDDPSLHRGWNPEDTIRLITGLEEVGVAGILVADGEQVLAGEASSLRSLASERFRILDFSDVDHSSLLFRNYVEQFADRDGLLRSLPVDSEPIDFAQNLAALVDPSLTVEARDRLYIEYLLKASHNAKTPLRAISAHQMLKNLDDPNSRDIYQGTLVLIGIESSMEHRLVSTPLGFYTPAEVYACLLNTLVQDKQIRHINPWLFWLTLWIFLFLASLMVFGQRPFRVLVVGLLLFYFSLDALGSLFYRGLVIPVVPSLTGLSLIFVFSVLREFTRAGNILKSFGGSEDAKLSGTETQASIFFTELPQYLMELEANESPQLLKCRREYNSLLERVAVKFHGRVLDYQGDAQMVGFGLRVDDDMDHALEATAAALEFVESCKALAEIWSVGPQKVQVHAGVCTGPIALGHVGADEKQDIAAIGDTTNTAARLMGAAMKQDRPVIIAESTYEVAKGALVAEELPPVELKGKSAPVAVYEAKFVHQEWLESLAASDKEAIPTGGVLEFKGGDRKIELAFVALVVAVVALLSSYFSSFTFIAKAELKVYDVLHRLVASKDADPRIVIVGLDEESADSPLLGSWPWSRDVYARAIKNLENTGYKGVFFDILFRQNRADDPEGDRKLVEAVLSEPRAVLAGILSENPDQFDYQQHSAPVLLNPLDSLDLLARGQIGLIHRRDDLDATTRRSLLAHPAGATGQQVLFPTSAVALLQSKEAPLIQEEDGLRVGEILIPSTVDETHANELLIRFGPTCTDPAYFVPGKTYRYVPFSRLLNTSDPIFGELEGCYLFVGDTFSSPELYNQDRVRTPMGSVKGVEVHARTLDTILNSTYIGEANGPLGSLWLLFLTGSTVVVVMRYRRFQDAVNRVLLLAFLHGFVVVSALAILGIWIRPLFPLLVMAGMTGGVLLSRYLLTTRALARFVPSEVVDEILLHGQAKDRSLVATVLLTDIRGYTTLSETRSAVQMLDILNEYHRRTVACYARHQGQALTYQGDAQIVVFGVFGKSKDPARDAVAAALELQSICDQLRAEWGITDRSNFDVGAGLCTGLVEVGFLGGTENRQYSVVGETVRKSHKVQSLSEELNAPVILDQETLDACKGPLDVDDLGMVLPKGLSQPIRLFRARGIVSEQAESGD